MLWGLVAGSLPLRLGHSLEIFTHFSVFGTSAEGDGVFCRLGLADVHA